MKEATGELNLTVVVVLIVALLVAFFFSVLWPMISDNFDKNTKCDEAVCTCEGHLVNGKCQLVAGDQIECTYTDKSGNEHEITCTWKG